ncbi:MAG: 2OG-Fe(II) oxygenase [Cyanophyceae cyanobacterium]
MTASGDTDCDSSLLNQQQFQGLVSQSLAFLQGVLADETVPPQERAQIALKILALSQGQSLDLSPLLASGLAHAGTCNDQASGQGNESNNAVAMASPAKQFSGPNGAQATQQLEKSAIAPKPASWNANGSILPPSCVKIENFLSKEENETAFKIALDNQEKFVGSSTTTDADDYRRSSVLYATYYENLYHSLRKRLLKMIPTVTKQLNSDPFLVSQVEMQMTAHNDECFYKIHNDSGSPETETRVLTYVYYFHREPKAYSGGALRIYETDLLGPATEPSEKFIDVVPDNNTVVLFDSCIKHEVRKVSCPSRKFDNSRFTLNGWLRRV